jgi:hypothetical protein
MKKFTKTMFLFVSVLCMTSFAAFAEEGLSDRVVKIKNASREKVMLTYLRDGKSKVHVKIRDEAGNEIFRDVIRSGKSFEKLYNVASLVEGKYTFEVSDDLGIVSESFLNVNKRSNVVAEVVRDEADKYRVEVKGNSVPAVFINIFDRRGQLVFSDYVSESRSFTKSYDLSKLQISGVRFEISSEDKNIARAIF